MTIDELFVGLKTEQDLIKKDYVFDKKVFGMLSRYKCTKDNSFIVVSYIPYVNMYSVLLKGDNVNK